MYRPRRQRKRWLDSDCPKGVLAIYDSPQYADRYTVFYTPWRSETRVGYLAASENPFDPQGIGQHGEMSIVEFRAVRKTWARKAATWSGLPEKVKQAVEQDLGG